jgi:hypothetical protein
MMPERNSMQVEVHEETISQVSKRKMPHPISEETLQIKPGNKKSRQLGREAAQICTEKSTIICSFPR